MRYVIAHSSWSSDDQEQLYYNKSVDKLYNIPVELNNQRKKTYCDYNMSSYRVIIYYSENILSADMLM